MMIFYVIYCITLHFNAPLEKWAHSLKLPIKLPTKEEQSALVTYKNLPDPNYSQGGQAVTSLSQEPPQAVPEQQQQDNYQDYSDPNAAWDPNASWDPNAAWGENAAPAAAAPAAASWNASSTAQTNSWDQNSSWDQQGQQNYAYATATGDQNDQSAAAPQQPQKTTGEVAKPQVGQVAEPEYYKSKDPKTQEVVNPLEKPIDGGIPAQISWAIVYPIHYMCRLTMPDCRTEKFRNWYPFTFFISMIWISFYSYFMVNLETFSHLNSINILTK